MYTVVMTGFKLDLSKSPEPLTLLEACNRDILRTLVEHPVLLKRIETEYKERVRKSSQTTSIKKLIMDRNLVKDLQRYSACHTSKGVQVKYKFGKGSDTGRVNPSGPSLAYFPRVIRELLSHGLMKDYDFENSAPSDLHQLMVMYGIVHPLLTEYVASKDTVLSDIMAANTSLTRGDARIAVLQVMMGGGLRLKSNDEKRVDRGSVQ